MGSSSLGAASTIRVNNRPEAMRLKLLFIESQKNEHRVVKRHGGNKSSMGEIFLRWSGGWRRFFGGIEWVG